MIKQIAKFKREVKLGFFISSAFLISYLCQISLLIPLILISLCAYFKFRKFGQSLLSLTLLFLIIFVIAYYLLRKNQLVYWIPFSVIPMLVILLFNSLELSLLMTLATSFSVAILSAMPFQLCLLSFLGGILAGILAQGARRRITIIRAGLLVGVMQALTLILIDHLWIGAPLRYLDLVLNGIISSGIVLLTLPIFEYLFKTVTNISLLELADFNHPLLQRMVLEAPGTYHHSLIVGNLSEAASSAIGVNALLARIGAYYHDIGKLQKPDYFSENQQLNESRHDVLAPTMSKLVIMNHVREGVDLAKKYRLNPRLIDFILQHHGNSLVYFFYCRALEHLEDDEEVKEEGFRYPGPKPNTKETATVLLADSVEAATRALKDPTPTKIEALVHKIINNKFIDGQLDECDLTLKDLERISAVFIRILSGIYHGRITYPETSVPS